MILERLPLMNKFLIAAVIGALSTSGMLATTSALAQTAGASAPAATKATARRPAPAKRLIKRRPKAEAAAAAKVDPVPEGSTKWACNEGLAFFLKGDMKRDQIVTVNWAKKSYQLPRQDTTTGVDLVVSPTKAMLFSDKDGSRLADECKTAEMTAMGTPAPTQSNELKK
jgi:hypothetical protein